MNTNETQPINMKIFDQKVYDVIENTDQKKCDRHGIILQFAKNKFYMKDRIIEHCSLCAKEEEELKEKEKEKELQAIEHSRLNHGIPNRFLGARLTDFDKIDTVLNWIKKPDGFLFIHGACGCGKSHLACAIKYHFNEMKISVKLAFSSELFLELRKSFNKKEIVDGEYSIIEKYAPEYKEKLDICIFDDVGAQKISEYVIEAWYDIIDRRYRNNYPTIFTSNFSLKEISICMTDRIASRLASGTIFELPGKDRRLIK